MRSRRLWLLAGLAVAALALGGALSLRALTETAEPATVAGAIERFRAQANAVRELPPELRGHAPLPGAYVYATRGFEVSHVLGTRRHAYPRRTAITVSATAGGCLRVRWDALARRSDAVLTCRRIDGGWQLVSRSEVHAFAGHVDRRTYRCTPASTHRPARLVVGARWSSRCTIDGTTTIERGTVLGQRTLALAGRRVRTLLLRTRTRLSGDTLGTGTTLAWVLPRTGLLVREAIVNANSTDTLVGEVRYEERATLALTSPRPRR